MPTVGGEGLANAGRLEISEEHFFFGIVNPPPTISMARPRVQTRYDFVRNDYVELYFTQRAAVRSLLQSSIGQLQGYTDERARISLNRSVGVFTSTEAAYLSIVLPDKISENGELPADVADDLHDDWTKGVVLGSGSVDLSDATVLLRNEVFGNPFSERCSTTRPWAYHGRVPLASRATYPSFVRLATGMAIAGPLDGG